jgi:hypothetical protein
MNKSTRFYFFILPLFAVCCYFLFRSVYLPLSDYAGYYFGSKELLQGNYRQVYDPASLNMLIHQHGSTSVYVSYTPFPPFTAICFSPFLWLNPENSKIIFTAFSLVLFIISTYRFIKFSNAAKWTLLLVPIIFFTPIRSNIYLGQAYLLLYCLLIEGFIAHQKRKWLLSSFIWAVAILLKIFPAIIIIWLIVKRKYKEAAFLLSACILLFVISIFICGIETWKYYILEIFPRLNQGELNDPFTSVFQSAFMLFKDLFVYDRLLNPSGSGQPYLFIIFNLLFKAFIIAASIRLTRKSNDDLTSFGIWILASLLISPNGSNYSLLLLLIPMIQLPKLFRNRPGLLTASLVILFLATNIPVYYFNSFPVLLKFPRLYLLLGFFAVILFNYPTLFSLKVFLLFSIIFLLAELNKFRKSNDNSDYLLTHEEHLLIYDYGIGDHRLNYFYWDEHGAGVAATGIVINDINKDEVRIVDNQLYYLGFRLTDSKDHKIKPAVINGSDIIYLSDKNRGVGFYTLRKINLRTTVPALH